MRTISASPTRPFTLNFSTGSAMVIAQNYCFVRYGYDSYSYIMHAMQANSRKLAEDIAAIGEFSIIGEEHALPVRRITRLG
jgi:glutamate decarboxylase